jgi:hypothetical protein
MSTYARFHAGQHQRTEAQAIATLLPINHNATRQPVGNLVGAIPVVTVDTGDTLNATAYAGQACALSTSEPSLIFVQWAKQGNYSLGGFVKDGIKGGDASLELQLCDAGGAVLARIAIKGEAYGTNGLCELSVVGGDSLSFDNAFFRSGLTAWISTGWLWLYVDPVRGILRGGGWNGEHTGSTSAGYAGSGWRDHAATPKVDRMNAPIGHSSWHTGAGSTYNTPDDAGTRVAFTAAASVAQVRLFCQAANAGAPGAGYRRSRVELTDLFTTEASRVGFVMGDSILLRFSGILGVVPPSVGYGWLPHCRGGQGLDAVWASISGYFGGLGMAEVQTLGANNLADTAGYAALLAAQAARAVAGGRRMGFVTTMGSSPAASSADSLAVQVNNATMRRLAFENPSNLALVELADIVRPGAYSFADGSDVQCFTRADAVLPRSSYWARPSNDIPERMPADLFYDDFKYAVGDDFSRWTGGAYGATRASNVLVPDASGGGTYYSQGWAFRVMYDTQQCIAYNVARTTGQAISASMDLMVYSIAGTGASVPILTFVTGSESDRSTRTVLAQITAKMAGGLAGLYAGSTLLAHITMGRRYRVEIWRTSDNVWHFAVGPYSPAVAAADTAADARDVSAVILGSLAAGMPTSTNWTGGAFVLTSEVWTRTDPLHPPSDGDGPNIPMAAAVTGCIPFLCQASLRRGRRHG